MSARPIAPRAALALLTLVYMANFVDRQLFGILAQPIKTELGLSDTRLGLLGGTAFALFYTILGLPIARVAERRSRSVIIAAALALWSGMTALTGLAHGFALLCVARIGVGVGEAGCAPPAQSFIADLYPPRRRATALAIFSLGVPLGMMASAIGGGWIAQALGWRNAFLALGLPGVALAAIVALVLRDPPRETRTSPDAPPPFVEVLRALSRRRAFLHMAAGASLASFAGYGLTSFAVPLLIRGYGLTLAHAATGFGLVVGSALTIGIGGGGWLSDRLTRRWPGAPGLVAAGGVAVGGLLFLLALAQRDPVTLALAAFVPFVGAHLYFGPTYGVTVNAVDARARATAIAVLLLAMNAIGLGLGPLAVGALSDHFAATTSPQLYTTCRVAGASASALCKALSADGLTRALRLDMLVYFWAAAHFLLAARALGRDQPQSVAR